MVCSGMKLLQVFGQSAVLVLAHFSQSMRLTEDDPLAPLQRDHVFHGQRLRWL